MAVRYWLYPTLTTLTKRLSLGEPKYRALPDYPFYPASWLSHSEGCTCVQVVTFVFMIWTLNKGFLGFSGSYFAERSWKGFPQWCRFMILEIYIIYVLKLLEEYPVFLLLLVYCDLLCFLSNKKSYQGNVYSYLGCLLIGLMMAHNLPWECHLTFMSS